MYEVLMNEDELRLFSEFIDQREFANPVGEAIGNLFNKAKYKVRGAVKRESAMLRREFGVGPKYQRARMVMDDLWDKADLRKMRRKIPSSL